MSEKKNLPSKGRGGKDNFPSSRAGLIQSEEDRVFVSKLLMEVVTEYTKKRVTSDEELQNRFDDYFRRCGESGQVPTVEELMMSSGFSISYMWDIESGRRKGFSETTADIIRKAKDFLKTFDAKLVVSGKMNFLAYCFRAKNYYGMSDKTEHVIIPSAPEADYNATEIASRYILEEGNDERDN